jgi:hypothetical protein
MLRDGFAADVIVLAQQRRGQWSAQAVERLRRAAPIAPLIGLMGSWSAAAGRSGHLWPGAIHVSAQRWENEILPGFKQLLTGECPWWARPGAEDDERRFRTVGAKSGKGTSVVAISALSRESEQWLADACRLGKHAVLILRPDLREKHTYPPMRGVTAMIWECPELRPDEEAPWRATAEALGAPPILLLQHFPRQADDVPRPGVAAVLAKPFTLSALLEHLELATRR